MANGSRPLAIWSLRHHQTLSIPPQTLLSLRHSEQALGPEGTQKLFKWPEITRTGNVDPEQKETILLPDTLACSKSICFLNWDFFLH